MKWQCIYPVDVIKRNCKVSITECLVIIIKACLVTLCDRYDTSITQERRNLCKSISQAAAKLMYLYFEQYANLSVTFNQFVAASMQPGTYIYYRADVNLITTSRKPIWTNYSHRLMSIFVKKIARTPPERNHRGIDAIHDFVLIFRDDFHSPPLFLSPFSSPAHLRGLFNTPHADTPLIYLAQKEKRAPYRRIKPGCGKN